MLEINNKICELRTIFKNIEKILGTDLRTLQFKDQDSREKIQKAITNTKLINFFQNETGDDLRASHLIMLLNTNLKCKTLVENDPAVGHVVGVIPTLSASIYFAMVNKLKLYNYLIEFVEMGSTVLILELVDIVAVGMKNVDHQDCSNILFGILQIITKRILRDECIYTSMKLHDQFRNIMLICKIKDCGSDDNNKSKDIDDIKQTGFIFHSLIRLFRSLTEMIYGNPAIPQLNIINLYEFQLPSKPSTWYPTSELQNREAILTSIYEIVFYKIRDMFYEFDLDMFMIWHEIETNGKTLQIAIGEETYLLVETLSNPIFKDNIPLSTSELVIMLESIVRKPEKENEKQIDLLTTLKQKVYSNTFDGIFLNYLNEYFNLCNNIEFIGLELSISLLHKLFDRNSWKEVDIDTVKSIMKKLINIIPMEELLILFPKFIELNGHNHFLVENNLVFPNIDFAKDDENLQSCEVKEFEIIQNTIRIGYYLSLQTLEQIIIQATNENAETKLFIIILNTLKPLCDSKIVKKSTSVLIHILESLLKSRFNLLLPTEKEKLSNLIFDMAKEKIIDRDEFLSKCLLPLLYVENINLRDLAGFLNLFREFFVNIECISTNLSISIILLQLIQILEECRWNIFDFSMDKVYACETSIEAIETIVDILTTNSIKVPSIEWLENHVKNYSSFNRIYLVKICSPMESNTLLEKLSYLICYPITNELLNELNANPDLFIISLSQLLMKCTRKEWHFIVKNFNQDSPERTEFIVDAMSKCISLLGYIINNYNNTNPNHCNDTFQYLGYLINNFLDILEKVKITSDIGKYMKRIATVFKFIPQEIISTCQLNIIKSMSEELPKLKESSPSNFDKNLYNFLITLFIL